MSNWRANLAQITQFDEVIDVRTPAEYAQDHLPGAINCPVLSDEERVQVGTLYKQVSPFAAKKVGAALVARHIAEHLEQHFLDKPRDWKPLLYCWRGGQRSGAMTHVLRQVGWQAAQLESGYKSYRHHVVETLTELPHRFHFRVVTGATGSGKSRLLETLTALGAQVLHLEELAAHKGSVLGDLPEAPQPGQRCFESQLLACLQALDAARPVYVEAESRKIGVLQVPDALLVAMRAGASLRIEASRAARTEFLIRDYAYFLAEPVRLKEKLARLKELQGKETLARWEALIDAGQWETLVDELLARHYDPQYQRSQNHHYTPPTEAARYATEDLSPAGIGQLAQRILADETQAIKASSAG